jgi:hypothetical protein
MVLIKREKIFPGFDVLIITVRINRGADTGCY